MLLKFLLGATFTGILACSAVAADFVIRIAPPRVQFQSRGRAPSRDHVWIAGYQRWTGYSYYWVPGHWEARPYPRARWEKPRYIRRGGGRVFLEGFWR